MLIQNMIDRKKEIVCYAAMVLLIHMYKITNYLPNWDSVFGMSLPYRGMVRFGRWFSGVSSAALHSHYDLQWVEGVVAAVFIALSAFVLVELFEMKRKPYGYIAAFLLAAFPSMAATFTYSMWLPAYMLALFFAICGTYLCIRGRSIVDVAVSTAFFALSLGIYQIYYAAALLVLVFYFLWRLLNPEVTLKTEKRYLLNFSAAFVLGAAIYWALAKIALRVFNEELNDYQGISHIGIMPIRQYVQALRNAKNDARAFFFSGSKLYLAINLVIAAFAVYLVIRTIVLNKAYSVIRKLCICAGFFLIVPITYCYYFFSPGVYYHKVMETGNYFAYFFVLALLSRFGDSLRKPLRNGAVLMFCVLCFYHFVNDNIAYQQLSMAYQRTEFEMSEVLYDVDKLEGSGEARKIAVIGRFPTRGSRVTAIPDITGATTANILVSQEHFVKFANYYFGRDYWEASDDEVEALEKSTAFAEMPEYPAGGYVALMDDTIVVKLVQ